MLKQTNQDGTTSRLTREEKLNRILLLPLIFIICIIPLIVKQATYSANLSDYSWFSSTDQVTDLMLYYKQWFVIGTGVVMLFILVCKLFLDFEHFKVNRLFIPLSVFGVFGLISSMASQYSYYSYRGMYEQFESIFAILTYVIIVFYAMNTIKYESDLRFLIRCMIVGILLISIVGITQYLGHDLLFSDFFEKFIFTKETYQLIVSGETEISSVFGSGRVYMTLYNPNYVGVYAALVMPILVCLMYFSKKLVHTVAYFVALVAVGICLIGSQSKAGMVSIVVALIVAIIFLRKQVIKKWYLTLAGVVGVVGVALLLIVPASPLYSIDLSSVFQTSQDTEAALEDITLDDYVNITYKGETLMINMVVTDGTYTGFEFIDSDGSALQEVSVSDDDSEYVINDSRWEGFTIKPMINESDSVYFFRVVIDDQNWFFTNQYSDDGMYQYINSNGKLDTIEAADTAVFTNMESLASNRGYIWAITAPLLSKYVFLGSGADTYAMVIPHNDYVSLYNYGFLDSILTKPHAMFLQMWVQIGGVATIAYIIFYVMYLISSVKLYFRSKFENYTQCVGCAIFIGSIGYVICSITNDSTICVAPVFWTLLGIGITINLKLLAVPGKKKKMVKKAA